MSVACGWIGSLVEGSVDWLSASLVAVGVTVDDPVNPGACSVPPDGKNGVGELKPTFEMSMRKVDVGLTVLDVWKLEYTRLLPIVSIPSTEITNNMVATQTQRGTSWRTRLSSSRLRATGKNLDQCLVEV